METAPTADGRPQSARVLLSYPPFVFNEAGTEIMNRLRFEPRSLPAGAACDTFVQNVIFSQPD